MGESCATGFTDLLNPDINDEGPLPGDEKKSRLEYDANFNSKEKRFFAKTTEI